MIWFCFIERWKLIINLLQINNEKLMNKLIIIFLCTRDIYHLTLRDVSRISKQAITTLRGMERKKKKKRTEDNSL